MNRDRSRKLAGATLVLTVVAAGCANDDATDPRSDECPRERSEGRPYPSVEEQMTSADLVVYGGPPTVLGRDGDTIHLSLPVTRTYKGNMPGDTIAIDVDCRQRTPTAEAYWSLVAADGGEPYRHVDAGAVIGVDLPERWVVRAVAGLDPVELAPAGADLEQLIALSDLVFAGNVITVGDGTRAQIEYVSRWIKGPIPPELAATDGEGEVIDGPIVVSPDVGAVGGPWTFQGSTPEVPSFGVYFAIGDWDSMTLINPAPPHQFSNNSVYAAYQRVLEREEEDTTSTTEP